MPNYKQKSAGAGGILYFYLLVMLFLSIISCENREYAESERTDYQAWSNYLGDKGGTQYSSLDQINVENVHQLQVSWIYATGDTIDGVRTEIQANPVVIGDTLYGTTPQLKVFALKADTGELLWTFNPFEGEKPANHGVNRGVEYWSNNQGEKRIFYVAGSRLYAINAKNGLPAGDFGNGGSVDFKTGLGRDTSDLFVSATSPGIVYRDLLIHGSRVSELVDSAPGHIRAFNVHTGEVEWIFHTIPQPGEFGHDTWPPDAWTRIGGANNWAGMSLDEKRGIAYIPTGSAAFDFYGGNRHGSNLFANSLLALDASTGKRIWHYQFVHHDLWDRDPPAAPALVTVERGGRRVDAVVQTTKTGHIFLFDRESGEPLFPIEEKKVPGSGLAGEKTWPTQPVPEKPAPFARQFFTKDDISDISSSSYPELLNRFNEIRTANPWDPPSLEGTLIFPGFDGGAEWGGAAVDPETGILYVNSNEMPWILEMIEVDTEEASTMSPGSRIFAMNCAACHGPDLSGDSQGLYPSLVDAGDRFTNRELESIIQNGRGVMPSFAHLNPEETDALISFLGNNESGNPKDSKIDMEEALRVPYAHTGWNRFLDSEGYPAIKPPWGTLNAIDLNTGEYVWKVRLGEFEELTKKGIPQTGTENYGGPAVTAGGLLFIGATKDEKFRAFNKTTGELLWETNLPAGGYATPSVYDVNGKQYIVIAAGGGKMGTKSGDSYVAFSLPDEELTPISHK